MSRALLTRLERLEALKHGGRGEKGLVVLEGSDEGRIDALISSGQARRDDVFITVARFGADTPAYADWQAYRVANGERRTIPMEALR